MVIQNTSKTWAKLQSFSPEDLGVKQAAWHRSCNKDAVHSGMLKRAKDRYERQLGGPNMTKRRKSNNAVVAAEIFTLTRSKTTPYDKNTCCFL
jgi:hypothetical protein